jgi:PAS domain S-box-containing protein
MNLFLRLSQGSRRTILAVAAVLIGVIVLVDWRNPVNAYFGFLYVFPMLLVGAVLSSWQIAMIALGCTVLAEIFDPFPFIPPEAVPQDVLLFIALAGMGLFSREATVNRRLEVEHRLRVEKEAATRREAEEQLAFVIQTSPLAIVVMSGSGDILLANGAADHLFRVAEGGLFGRNISRYIPALGRVPSAEQTGQTFRTEMQCPGKRDNGEIFMASVFFSTYKTALGPRLAALVVDTSEDLRGRAEYGLEQLMAGSRIVVGAVFHEVRNVCSAIAVMYENLARSGDFTGSQDFEALGSLVEALNRIASVELRKSAGGATAEAVNLAAFLDEARIVLGPYCVESDIDVSWEVPDALPSVWADSHSLLNVLLNLAKNSCRALEGSSLKRIKVSVTSGREKVSIRFCDTGPGIASAEKLFQPLQQGADATGLGLFLSRAFVRSFGGDLRYEPQVPGCCFVIDLAVAGNAED